MTVRKMALYGMYGAILLTLFSTWIPDRTGASPVSPLVIDQAFGISGATPWVSPTGEQLVTYLRQDAGAVPLPGLTARNKGGPFSLFQPLSSSPGLTPPVAAFGSDGTARLLWQAAVAGEPTEQATRPPLAPPGAAGPAGACNGPAAVAVSKADVVLSACQVSSGDPLRRVGLAGVVQMPSPIDPGTEVTPAVEELTSEPLVAWGTDGTGIVAFGYREGDPAERKIAARIVGADGSVGETEFVDSATDPGTLVPTGVAVLPNGTTAITAVSGEGAVLYTRPAGPGQTFQRIPTGDGTASMPAADRWGRLHFLASTVGGSGETIWSSRVLDLDGSLRNPIPVPTRGTVFEPVENGFQVFPNGGEALVMKSAGAFSVFFRNPGPNAFFLPRDLVRTTTPSSGSVARTPAGDLLLAWDEVEASGLRRLMVGGWDESGRPKIERISFPRRTKRGARITLSVVASDTMGISRVVWKLPGNRKFEGSSVRVRLQKRGVNRVTVSVTDRAGNRTSRTRRIKVSVPKRPSGQGRPGTSGSPRP